MYGLICKDLIRLSVTLRDTLRLIICPFSDPNPSRVEAVNDRPIGVEGVVFSFQLRMDGTSQKHY